MSLSAAWSAALSAGPSVWSAPSAGSACEGSAWCRGLQAGAVAIVLAATAAAAGDWPEFRGAEGRGVAPAAAIPTRWTADEGIAWKAALPGRGASSPIVVGDLVVVTAASGPKQDRLHVLAFDRGTGAARWQRTFWATGRTLCHATSSVAAGTPASQGGRIVALFSSCDLFCLDLDGRLVWQRNLAVEHPRSGNDVGMGASPRIVDGSVVVQIDCQGDAFASGIDLESGVDRWTAAREKIAGWSSPLAVPLPGQTATEPPRGVLLQNPAGLELRQAADGTVVWSWRGECAGIPMTAERAGRLFVPADGMLAIDPRAAAEPIWKAPRLACGIASPLVCGDRVVTINRAGVLVVGDAADGSIRGQVRLEGSFWASPIVVGTTVIAVGKEGKVFLVSLEGEPRILATNELPGTFPATPAVADGSLYLRSESTLWKVAGRP